MSSSPLSDMPSVARAINSTRDDAFAQLGAAFLTRLPATPLPDPYVVGFSAEAARMLGFCPSIAGDPAFAEFFCGNTSASWSARALPYASVYSGHQFGVWAGQLGDGRALGLGEVEFCGQRHELQLKGSGPTPYSRMGDGRAVLRSSIREFLCSEAMHHLGIPTTRALCVIGSDQPVRREETESAAVITRIAPSFARFGHFEHFYANDKFDALKTLADHLIARFYPWCGATDDPYLALLSEAVSRTAELVAQWQAVGFCHGVLNTDNMSVLGLTLDYGPFGFIDAFDANYICNHSDTAGRYAYRMQPRAAHWNCYCLAQSLLPLIDTAKHGAARDVLDEFEPRFTAIFNRLMRAKLGLTLEQAGDDALANRLVELMQANQADFTLTFRHLAGLSKQDASHDAPLRDLFIDRAGFDLWAHDYRARLVQEPLDDAARQQAMKRVNPKYVLRNHLAETAIRRAKEKDFSEVARLAAVLRHPFDEQPEYETYAALPPEWASSLELSCSS